MLLIGRKLHAAILVTDYLETPPCPLYSPLFTSVNQSFDESRSPYFKMAKSIFARKADLIYLTFFLTHLVVMFNVDLYPLWPVQIRPAYMDTLRKWYITTYRDQFFVSPP